MKRYFVCCLWLIIACNYENNTKAHRGRLYDILEHPGNEDTVFFEENYPNIRKEILPDRRRYDSLCQATGLPLAFFVYADGWEAPYHITIAHVPKTGEKWIVCDISLGGKIDRTVFHVPDLLDFLSRSRADDINNYVLCSSYQGIIFRYCNIYRSTEEPRIILKKFSPNNLANETNSFLVNDFLGRYGFVAYPEKKDSTMYISLNMLDDQKPAKKEKIRLLSPFIITAILKDSTRYIKQLTYIESRPKGNDTILTYSTAGWQMNKH